MVLRKNYITIGGTAWVEKAPKLGTETHIMSLFVYNGKLYGGTRPNGKLYEWNGTNAWVEKAPNLGGEQYIYSLCVFNGKLYGGTYPSGKLYEWNGVNAWVEKAPTLGAEMYIFFYVFTMVNFMDVLAQTVSYTNGMVLMLGLRKHRN